jgi:hypothetical protein
MLAKLAHTIKYDYIDTVLLTDANKHCPYCVIWFGLVLHTWVFFFLGLGIGISMGMSS